MTMQTQHCIKSQQIELASRPEGVPKRGNFSLKTVELSPIKDSEILVRNHWMSVDPYMRGRMKTGDSYVSPFEIGKPLDGGCIGEVIESNNDHFQVGDHVLGNSGWREYWKSDGHGVQRIHAELAPIQAYLGALGMTGLTAWVGLRRIVELQRGCTVFVSAASGAVGSIACQIAKASGCTVIGSAGKEEKIEWLKQHAGIDNVINYKTTNDLSKELGKLAPNGIDVYFDNVGSTHLEAAIDHMNDFGCIVCCGMISTYNETVPNSAPRNLFKVIGKRLNLKGMIVGDHLEDRDEFIREVSTLIHEGKIVWKETITEGLENAPKAFIGLFDGENVGKALVRLNFRR